MTGLYSQHDTTACPVRATFRCRRCHVRGHLAADCGESWAHWERPASLEELIAPDVRARWGILGSTETCFETPRGSEGTDRERKIEIAVSSNDKKMRDFMKENDIATTHKTEDNLQRIREWVGVRGLRLRIL